jgi:ABC-2 type transport system ATP-binding protein
MARGRVVADGPPTEIKAKVGGRTIRVTLNDVSVADLAAIDGVTNAEQHGETFILNCPNSDSVLRTVLNRYPDARDIEVRGAGLEEAFLDLTGDDDEDRGAHA